MVSCLFLSFLLITSEVYCVLTKVDWLAVCIVLRVVGAVLVVCLRRWRKMCTYNPPVNRKQGLITEEINQTLLTNKKQGNLNQVNADYIIKPT
jgi:hypothetical protein